MSAKFEPFVYTEDGKIHMLDDEELLLVLPELEDYKELMVKLHLKIQQNGNNMIKMVLKELEKLLQCLVLLVHLGII